VLGVGDGVTAPPVAVVAPVHGNAATLVELADRLGGALGDRPWRLRLVVDASPDGSGAVAAALAAADPRVVVTELTRNRGQHAALVRGLADEAGAGAWVCLDADLQDPPEAVPLLLERLEGPGGVAAVFAGRRGAYESWARRATGALHRRLLAGLTGLPPDAGAFLALDARARAAVLTASAPSVVAAIGASGLPTASVPVARLPRPGGRSSWTWAARASLSVRTLAWAGRQRLGPR